MLRLVSILRSSAFIGPQRFLSLTSCSFSRVFSVDSVLPFCGGTAPPERPKSRPHPNDAMSFSLPTSFQSQLHSRSCAEAFLSQPFRRARRRQATSFFPLSRSWFLRRFSFINLRSFRVRLGRTSCCLPGRPWCASWPPIARDACKKRAREAQQAKHELHEHVLEAPLEFTNELSTRDVEPSLGVSSR